MLRIINLARILFTWVASPKWKARRLHSVQAFPDDASESQRSFPALAALILLADCCLEISFELVNIGLVDFFGRHNDQLVFRNP